MEYVIIQDSRKDKDSICILADRRFRVGFWTDYDIKKAKVFHSQYEAENALNSLKYNNPRVVTLEEANLLLNRQPNVIPETFEGLLDTMVLIKEEIELINKNNRKMTKQFLTSKEVSVVKGYLSSDSTKVQPIYNREFIAAQNHAEYVITFAKLAKGKDFNGKKADSIEVLKAEVLKALSSKDTEYVAKPKEVSQPTTKKLADEALAFIKYGEEVGKTEKVNKFLQQFNVIQEFEEIGLFFEQEIVKLDKIYTIKEIVEAVKSVIDLLD